MVARGLEKERGLTPVARAEHTLERRAQQRDHGRREHLGRVAARVGARSGPWPVRVGARLGLAEP